LFWDARQRAHVAGGHVPPRHRRDFELGALFFDRLVLEVSGGRIAFSLDPGKELDQEVVVALFLRRVDFPLLADLHEVDLLGVRGFGYGERSLVAFH